MTGPVPALESSKRLNRPSGYFPRRTSLGLVGLVGLLAGTPFVALACAAPFTLGGFDRLLAFLPWILGFGIVTSLAVAFSMVTHRYWSVCLFFYIGWAMLIAYVLTMVFALAAVAGLFTAREAGLGSMPVVGLIMLVLRPPALAAPSLLAALDGAGDMGGRRRGAAGLGAIAASVMQWV